MWKREKNASVSRTRKNIRNSDRTLCTLRANYHTKISPQSPLLTKRYLWQTLFFKNLSFSSSLLCFYCPEKRYMLNTSLIFKRCLTLLQAQSPHLENLGINETSQIVPLSVFTRTWQDSCTRDTQNKFLFVQSHKQVLSYGSSSLVV